MGAAISRQRQATEAAEAAAATAAAAADAAAADAAAAPPRPAPYCPPWALQPGAAQQQGAYGSMALVPASAAFGHAFHSTPAMGSYSGTSYAQPMVQQPPFAGGGGYYGASASWPVMHHNDSQASMGSSTSGGMAAQRPPRASSHSPTPRPPASPAEAKAQELVLNQLSSFNLHADTVAARQPSPRLPMAQQPVLPLVAMCSPR